MRETCSDTSGTIHWIILLGKIDYIKIEDLNTVLDDNKLLCLKNKDRIVIP